MLSFYEIFQVAFRNTSILLEFSFFLIQINKAVTDSSINLIFAVTADQLSIYDLLANEIDVRLRVIS